MTFYAINQIFVLGKIVSFAEGKKLIMQTALLYGINDIEPFFAVHFSNRFTVFLNNRHNDAVHQAFYFLRCLANTLLLGLYWLLSLTSMSAIVVSELKHNPAKGISPLTRNAAVADRSSTLKYGNQQ
ncbi:MAG: hypothetical protein HWE26_17520 [Alteromonadaceae bacterium]|nr:hypothetical protein [Alteromonadaceae bacterium]